MVGALLAEGWRRVALVVGLLLERWQSRRRLVGGRRSIGRTGERLAVVNEMTTRPIGTEACRVEGATEFGLVLRVPGERAQFGEPMGKLAFFAVLASAILLKGPTQFGLVPGGVLLLLLLLRLIATSQAVAIVYCRC